MISLIRLKGVSLICSFAVLFFAFSGCVKLEKKFPDIRTYALDISSQPHSSYEGEKVSIRLNAFSVVPAFSDRYLAYRTDETSYEQDFYNQMMVSPARMVQDQVFAWLKGSPLVSYLLPLDSVEDADYVIDAKLVELSGDYRQTDEPKAVIKIQFTITRTEAGNNNAIFQKLYASETPINQPSPKLLTEGWNNGLGQIMASFENDFRDAVINSPSK